jgi:hypothetical protein
MTPNGYMPRLTLIGYSHPNEGTGDTQMTDAKGSANNAKVSHPDPLDVTEDRLLRDEDIWREWRDAMLGQDRAVAPERMTFSTLADMDKALDDTIADRLVSIIRERQPAVASLATLREALGETISSARGGMAKQHLDQAGVMNDPPHGWGKFSECEAPWCKRNQEKLAQWVALLSDSEEAPRTVMVHVDRQSRFIQPLGSAPEDHVCGSLCGPRERQLYPALAVEAQVTDATTKAPYGWAAEGSTLFVWDDAALTRWHAVYDLEERAHADRNLGEEVADTAAIAAALNQAEAVASLTAQLDKKRRRIETYATLLGRAEDERDETRAQLEQALAQVAIADQLAAEAIAHDRQPYPTAFAYERVCELLEQERAEKAALVEALKHIANGVNTDEDRDAELTPGQVALDALDTTLTKETP